MSYSNELNHVKKDKINVKKLLLVVFIVSLTIRLLFGVFIFIKEGTSKFGDDKEYINYAKNMISQGIFVPDIIKLDQSGGTHMVGPGFPFIIALTFKVFGEKILPIIFLNVLISSLLCVLIFYIGKELFDEKVGLFASVWSIFYVLFIQFIPHVLKEPWLAFLFPLIILLFLKETKKNKISSYLILLSILYAFFIHMDERYFAYFPVLCMGFIFLDQNPWKNGLKKALSFSLIVLALMVPWLIRNYIVYNRIIIISVRTAPITEKLFGYPHVEYYDSDRGIWYLNPDQINSVLRGNPVTTNRGLKISEEQAEAMRDGIIPKPFSRFESYLSRFVELWEPIDLKRSYKQDGYRFDGVWSLRHNLSVGLTYGILLPFAFIGCILFLKQKQRIAIFMVSILFFHSLIHLLFIPYTIGRYRIPIDAFIIIIAFYGFQQLYLKFQNWKINKRKSMAVE